MKYYIISLFLIFCYSSSFSQQIENPLLRSFKPDFSARIEYIDLDNDGDPDLIKSTIADTLTIYWIDDDDDMKSTDFEGDLDNDCLIIDRNNDGFFDLIKYDLDGDTIYESTFNLNELGIKTTFEFYNPGEYNPEKINTLFSKAAEQMWNQAEVAMNAAATYGISYKWYAQLMHPKSLTEKYRNGYWLQFYLFFDFLEMAKRKNNEALQTQIINAYFQNNWESLIKYLVWLIGC